MKIQKILYTLICLLSILSFVQAQKEENIWVFGGKTIIDFNTNPPTSSADSKISVPGGAAAIADTTGNLLFYTDGLKVYNKTHTLVENGDGLNGNSDKLLEQQVVIAQKPNTNNQYYIITNDGTEDDKAEGINYSLVEFSAAHPLGIVTEKNKNLINGITGQLTLTNAANGESIWLVTHRYPSDTFYFFSIDRNGINPTPKKQAIGRDVPFDAFLGCSGLLRFSPQHDKLIVFFTNLDYFEAYDFDNCKGELSNRRVIKSPILLHGVDFNAKGDIFYTSYGSGKAQGSGPIYQWLWGQGATEQSITASSTKIGELIKNDAEGLRRGPDGKIYILEHNQKELSVVNQPDVVGTGCDLQLNALKFQGASGYRGLLEPVATKHTFKKKENNNNTLAMIDYVSNCQQEPLLFEAKGVNPPLVTSAWDFGDSNANNNMAEGLKTQHIFSDTGTFHIRLTYTDQCLTDTLEKDIEVKKCKRCNLYIPNAFSPDANTHNDFFKPEGLCEDISNFNFEIYNRWGNQLFKTNDPLSEGWDGKYRGTDTEQGVYVWFLRYTYNGKDFAQKGDVLILR